jgi:glyoxylase-like metal-dependent hydrolase (beta-lactamase superfamily II)
VSEQSVSTREIEVTMPADLAGSNEKFDIVFDGFPGKSERGYLGWSSAILLKGERLGLFDTAGINDRVELVSRLRTRNLSPGDIDYVIASHFHFDHVGNLPLFPKATLYLHEMEIDAARQEPQSDLAVPTELYQSLRDSGRLVVLQGESGSVEGYRWIHTPGHTPGSICLSVHHDGSSWIFASDAVKNLLEARTGEVWMTIDQNQSRESISKIVSEADWIVPGHDRVLRIDHNIDPPSIWAVGKSSLKIELAQGYPGIISGMNGTTGSEHSLVIEVCDG